MKLQAISEKEFWANKPEVCYQYAEVAATASDLIEILGDIDRQGDYEKAQFNWFLRLECRDGEEIFATIYDWKEYRDYPLDEVIQWHIGASSEVDARVVAAVFRDLLSPEKKPLSPAKSATIYTLTCVNEEYDVVSTQHFPTLEDAQQQMEKEFERELEEAKSCGYDDIENNCVSTCAYIEYGKETKYHWGITSVPLPALKVNVLTQTWKCMDDVHAVPSVIGVFSDYNDAVAALKCQRDEELNESYKRWNLDPKEGEDDDEILATIEHDDDNYCVIQYEDYKKYDILEIEEKEIQF